MFLIKGPLEMDCFAFVFGFEILTTSKTYASINCL
jgi:hypothetical protein